MSSGRAPVRLVLILAEYFAARPLMATASGRSASPTSQAFSTRSYTRKREPETPRLRVQGLLQPIVVRRHPGADPRIMRRGDGGAPRSHRQQRELRSIVQIA